MVIGVFFSEVGTGLLEILTELDHEVEKFQEKLSIKIIATDKEFQKIRQWLPKHNSNIETDNIDWKGLKIFLLKKRDFMLRLLENSNLLEHESFTDMLWAIFHLTEELVARKNLQNLPREDYLHLDGDIKRVYKQLTPQWLKYMEHLKISYPYLFSLALRTNPFNRNASPILPKTNSD